MILILSGDIELNPGPADTNQIIKEDFEVFNNKGLHFMHLNINGLLNKIDELRYIARSSNAAVIGITETKLDNTVYDSEVTVDGYNIVRNARSRNDEWVACYMRITFVLTGKLVSLTKEKTFSLIFCLQKQNLYL